MMNDLSLVAQVTVFGNKRAFDALVGKYQSSVRRFFLNQTLGDGQLSDDLAQETFIKAYTHLSMFRGRRLSRPGYSASPIMCSMTICAAITIPRMSMDCLNVQRR